MRLLSWRSQMWRQPLHCSRSCARPVAIASAPLSSFRVLQWTSRRGIQRIARAGDNLDEVLEDALAAALEAGTVRDAVIARSERERAAFWKLRETIPEAQRRDGASLKHDISLPISALADFVRRAGAYLTAHVPEGRLVAYGHVGDGNLHFNLNQSPGADAGAFLAREAAIKRAVHDLVRECGGSFSAEHGIGRLKVGELERYASAVELDLMRAVKRAFDPNGIMNPGKVLRSSS
jgi:FAD/FMN-containing dehydrogenase